MIVSRWFFTAFVTTDLYTHKKDAREPDSRLASILVRRDTSQDGSNECSCGTECGNGLLFGVCDLLAAEIVPEYDEDT
jgi:hypothetical protein